MSVSRTDKIKLGVVGCGDHASENLIPCLWLNRHVEVVAVCDLSFQLAKQVAAQFPNAHAYEGATELVQTAKVDAIVAAAPPQVHTQVAMTALARGIHIFVEKPPTVNTADLTGLVAESRRTGLVTMVGHNLRHSAASLALKAMSCEEGFGTPFSMEVRYFASKPRGDRWQLGSAIRSFLLSHVNHAVDLMSYHVGCPSTVDASAEIAADGGISLAARFGFGNGGVGTLFASTCMPHFSVHATLLGASGGYAVMQSLNEVTAYGVGGDHKRHGRNWIEQELATGFRQAGYQTELDQFIEAIARKGEAHPSFEDELAVYRVIDEMERQITRSI